MGRRHRRAGDPTTLSPATSDPRRAPERPLLIGHRFGNALGRLGAARAAGVDLIETDIHFYKGRLEVRHMKTLGPIGILWDKWRLGNPFAPRLELSEVLAALRPDEEIMLDLKPIVDARGNGERMADAILEELERARPGAPATICSRRWDYLPYYRARANTRVVYSCGSTAERDRLLTGPQRIDGISIREDFVTPEIAPHLVARGGLVMSWAVNDIATLERLAALGVTGFISDAPGAIGAAVRAL